MCHHDSDSGHWLQKERDEGGNLLTRGARKTQEQNRLHLMVAG